MTDHQRRPVLGTDWPCGHVGPKMKSSVASGFGCVHTELCAFDIKLLSLNMEKHCCQISSQLGYKKFTYNIGSVHH